MIEAATIPTKLPVMVLLSLLTFLVYIHPINFHSEVIARIVSVIEYFHHLRAISYCYNTFDILSIITRIEVVPSGPPVS